MSTDISTAERIEPSPVARLPAAYQRRTAARARVVEKTAERTRARETAQAAQAEAERLKVEENSWIARHSTRVESWLRAGHSGLPPSPVPSDQSFLKRRAAEANAEATAQALTRIEAEYTDAHIEARAAEQAVMELVDAIEAAKARVKAELILDYLAKIHSVGCELHALLPDQLHTPLGQLATLNGEPIIIPSKKLIARTGFGQQIDDARDLLNYLTDWRRGRINIPGDILRGERDPVADLRAQVAEQRRQLIEGPTNSTE